MALRSYLSYRSATLGVTLALEKDILCQGAPVLEVSARADIL